MGKYNKIKHDRIQNYGEASLEAVVNGMDALYIIEIYELYEMYRLETDTFQSAPSSESNFFIMLNWTEHMRSSKVKFDNPLIDDDDGQEMG